MQKIPTRDPGEQKNLAGKPEHAVQLKNMMQTLTTVLESFPDHPYGELFPGGDTTGRASGSRKKEEEELNLRSCLNSGRPCDDDS